MARRETEDRYIDEGFDLIVRDDEVVERTVLPDNNTTIDQATTQQVTADQNNYALPAGQTFVTVVGFTTDAARTFTGFAGARPGIVIFCNRGSNNGVIANNNASSTDENRVLCHTGADITLNGNESAIMFYDYNSSKWRTVGFV